jgi:hypothetical protein
MQEELAGPEVWQEAAGKGLAEIIRAVARTVHWPNARFAKRHTRAVHEVARQRTDTPKPLDSLGREPAPGAHPGMRRTAIGHCMVARVPGISMWFCEPGWGSMTAPPFLGSLVRPCPLPTRVVPPCPDAQPVDHPQRS